MLCNVNGTLYAVSFFHLSQSIYVSAGQSVSQGQTIALSGADFAWGTGWSGGSTCEAGSAAPCRERPEKFFS